MQSSSRQAADSHFPSHWTGYFFLQITTSKCIQLSIISIIQLVSPHDLKCSTNSNNILHCVLFNFSHYSTSSTLCRTSYFCRRANTSGPAIPDAFDLSTMLRDLNVDSNTHCAYSLKVDAIIEWSWILLVSSWSFAASVYSSQSFEIVSPSKSPPMVCPTMSVSKMATK